MSPLQNKRVLVVDDEPFMSELISTRLGIAGCDTRVAADGMAAISRIREFRPEAMVLDINMPILDGFGVMAALGQVEMQRLPTLVLTARHRADDVKMAITLGARDYLAKPFEQRQLLARVARLFRR